jgi:hypothetical protein
VVLRGQIHDVTGTPVPGVLVLVERGLVGHEAISDGQGRFALPPLPPGAGFSRSGPRSSSTTMCVN